MLGEGKVIKAFVKIDDNKGSVKFKFTEECLDYINPWRYFLKHIALNGLSKEEFVDQ